MSATAKAFPVLTVLQSTVCVLWRVLMDIYWG